MANKEAFVQSIQDGYTFKGENYPIGVAVLDGVVQDGVLVNLPLRTMNRHGLIAGATGTGKTKTLQMITETLSNASVPVMVMDIKGDLSGLAMPGTANEKVTERCQHLKITYQPQGCPAELLCLGDKSKGVKLRATVTEFGPILLSKILDLNDTQGGVVSMIFKYCDDTNLPLVDLKDFIKVLQYIGDEGKEEIEKTYGKISTTSTGTILRKVIELQQQGADAFFGEKSFEVDDLMRISNDGRGMVSILRCMDLQDKPKLFSTFMLQLLAELYATCPEEGDIDKPKLVLFIDEAHLIFQEASEALLQQIETIIKLIRSKGVGIFFVTQNPMDVPASVLGQLGLKIQHALRAFTAADRKSIKQTAENYPITEFYDIDEMLTQLGIGEAFVTLLSEKGIPTPLVHCMMAPPRSRMDVLTESEVDQLVDGSKLAKKYNEIIDSESAFEILTKKLEVATQQQAAQEQEQQQAKEEKKESKEKGFFDNTVVKQVGRTAASVLTRGLLGALGLGGRKKKGSWF
jgi:DNA helicase HerA-like ATPase